MAKFVYFILGIAVTISGQFLISFDRALGRAMSFDHDSHHHSKSNQTYYDVEYGGIKGFAEFYEDCLTHLPLQECKNNVYFLHDEIYPELFKQLNGED